MHSSSSSTKVSTRNPVWNEQLILPFFSHHLLESECDDPENNLIYKNEELRGYMQIAFFDINRNKVGKSSQPIAQCEFPLQFFEPFKPIYLQIRLPLVNEDLENDLNFELEQLNIKKGTDAYYRMKKQMQLYTVEFDPVVYISINLQTASDLPLKSALLAADLLRKPPQLQADANGSQQPGMQREFLGESNKFIDPELQEYLG